MAKKTKKADEKNGVVDVVDVDGSSMLAKSKDTEQHIKTLIEKGGKKGAYVPPHSHSGIYIVRKCPPYIDSDIAALSLKISFF